MKYLLTLLLFISTSSISAVVYEKLNVTDSQGREIVSLRVEGDIQEYEEYELYKAINDINQNNHHVQFDSVVLNSDGGSMYSAIKMGAAIRGNHLSTLVQPNDSCASACVLLLQAGVCKIAEGSVGLHRAASDLDVDLENLPAERLREKRTLNQYLTSMNAHPQVLWYMTNTPHWSIKLLSEIEKQDFGYYSATAEEMDYRMEIASQKLGQFKRDLYASITKKTIDSNPDENENPYHPIRFPSCTEQLFLDDASEHVGVNIEPNPEDIFEIYQWDQGISENNQLKSTQTIPYKDGQPYYYSFSYFAKGKEVVYQERVTVSAPTVWGEVESGLEFDNQNPDIQVSADKKSVIMTRRDENNGFAMASWVLTKDDPQGKITIDIIFKDKIVKTFDFITQ